MTTGLTRYAGWAAYLSGAVAIVGNIFLILFYVLQAPRLIETRGINAPDYLGRVNDAAVGIQALLLIPIVLAFLGAMQLRAPVSAWQRVVAVAAMISILVIGCIQFLYALYMIAVETQTNFVLPAWGTIGLWMILTHYRARTHRLLSASLAWLGIAVGAAYVLLFISFFGFGGPAATASTDPSAFFSNYPFIIAIFVSLLIGFFAYPIWAIWLGRVLLSGRLTEQSTVKV